MQITRTSLIVLLDQADCSAANPDVLVRKFLNYSHEKFRRNLHYFGSHLRETFDEQFLLLCG